LAYESPFEKNRLHFENNVAKFPSFVTQIGRTGIRLMEVEDAQGKLLRQGQTQKVRAAAIRVYHNERYKFIYL
jgi:hypothetical protein